MCCPTCSWGWTSVRRRTAAGACRKKTLFLVTALFGGLGGVLGMHMFRHKTKHWYFRVFFPLLLIVQIAVLVMLFGVRL